MKNFTSTLSKVLVLCLISLTIFTSCEKEDPIVEDPIIEVPKGPYENGVFISNEGAWGNENASVSFYSYDANTITNNIFELENERKIGDVLQSVTVAGDTAYLIVNASNKVEIINKNTFEEAGTIDEGILSPRYLKTNGNNGYLSCWGDNSIKVIDLSTQTITTSISVGSGPEKMAIANNKLFVANSGGWATDSIISVIDLTTNTVVASIPVKYSPRDLEVDIDGYIWALCYGKVVYEAVEPYAIIEETPSKLYKIDPSDNSVMLEITLFENLHPSILEIDKDGSTLYVGAGSGYVPVYKIEITSEGATATQIVPDYAYGFAYDITSDMLFVTVAPNWTGAGTLYRYTTTGEKQGEYTVGVGPNGASFKNAEE